MCRVAFVRKVASLISVGKQSGKHSSNLLPGIHIRDLLLGKAVLFATVPLWKLHKHHCQENYTSHYSVNGVSAAERMSKLQLCVIFMCNIVCDSEGTWQVKEARQERAPIVCLKQGSEQGKPVSF